MQFPPPRREPNEREAFEGDVIAFAEAWAAFVLNGLTLAEARRVLQTHTERLRALAHMREGGL